VYEAKLDGWRCLVEVSGGRVQVWSPRGGDYTTRLPELQILSCVGDVVLDGELVVVTDDGRADFELLSTRVIGSNRRLSADTPITLYVFDVLPHDGRDVCGGPWTARRAMLDKLDLAGATSGIARTVSYTDDGEAMHQATLAVGAEGTVSKKTSSIYLPGQRVSWWTKTKHRRTAVFTVVGWRPSTAFRPGGLVVAEGGEVVGVASLALPEAERTPLVDLLQRYGRSHPTGTITIPEDCVTATVRFTSRTPTHGLLREATVVAVQPMGRRGQGSSSNFPRHEPRRGHGHGKARECWA
jgi:bifunctional non-homologous end joining protein LigD